MKILILSWNFPPTVGGIETHISQLFEGLLRAGHSVEVITSAAPGEKVRGNVHRASRSSLPGYLAFALTRGLKQCRANRPDLIFCGSIVTSWIGLILSKWHRVPLTMIAYGSDLVYPGKLYRPVSRWLFRRMPQILAISKSTRELLLGIGVKADRIEIVPPGVSVEDFESEPMDCAEALLKRIEGRKVVLSVGRLVHRKGLVEFVDHVMPRLVESLPDVVLVITGDDAIASLVHAERIRGNIEKLVREKGLEEYVILTGTLPYRDVVKLFFRSDVFILPAVRIPGDAEGFGIVFLEAALAGSPTVSTRIGGIPDAVLDGETGLLVEPGDNEGLCAAVTRMLTDQEFHARCAEAAATRARNEFSWDAITAKYVDAFRKIVP